MRPPYISYVTDRMSKRVFQIAKELGMASKSLIERIKDLGIDDSVTNALSSLSEENVRKLKAALANEAPPSEEKPLAAGVVRRRAPRRRTVTETKPDEQDEALADEDRKSTRLNSSHV